LQAFVEFRGLEDDVSCAYDLVLSRQPDPEDVSRVVANQVANERSRFELVRALE